MLYRHTVFLSTLYYYYFLEESNLYSMNVEEVEIVSDKEEVMTGNVPAINSLFSGAVPANNFLLTGTVTANKLLLIGTCL